MLPTNEEIRLSFLGRRWGPNSVQLAAYEAVEQGTHYVGIVGGARSGKTSWLLGQTIWLCLKYPGYPVLLARYTDEATQSILKPMFYQIARDQFDPRILTDWNAREERQGFANGSSVIIRGLKSGDDANRYAKFDGLSLGAYAISQAEEVPLDVWARLKTRLSYNAPGTPRHGLFELNPAFADHHLRREFEPDIGQPPDTHKLIHASVWDNKANLPEGYIAQLENDYPAGHPLRHRLLEGKWGLAAQGDPIIGPTLFNPDLHIKEVEFDPQWPLLLSYDPGMRHPCLTWAQMDGYGRLKILDCFLGTDIDADTFFFEAFRRQTDTIGRVKEVRACADRASEQRHGSSTRTEFDIFRDHLRPWGVVPLTGVVASELYLIQRLASRFTRLVRGEPAIVFHPRASVLIEAMMGGWVWRQPTDLRPTAQTPVDNYYAHPADTLLYLEKHYGPGIRTMEKVSARDDEVRRPPRRRATASGY